MANSLTFYVRLLISNPSDLKSRLNVPVLIWESPPSEAAEPLLLGTLAGASLGRPRASDPLVFELRKGESQQNAFSMGVTVGRTENNDVAVEHNSVSRFHAWFQVGTDKIWRLHDAESSYGTEVDGERLGSGQFRALESKHLVRFGQVAMTFLLPEEFFALIDGQTR